MSKKEQKAFAQQLKFEPSTFSSQHKIGFIDFSPTKQEYELMKEDWTDEISQKCFSGNKTYEDYKLFKDESIRNYFDHHCEGLFEKRDHFKGYITDYIMDLVLQIWHYLFNVISPDTLCMNSMAPNLFVTTNKTAIKSAFNSIRRLTNGKLFEGIDIFLVPILNNFYYHPCVMNLAKNEGYVID